jgi:ATP-dependent exoDNAse (exonuclease V) alpha subunit
VHASEHDGVAVLVEQWQRARTRHGERGVVMIAQANRTRELLNRAARERLKRDHLLSDHGVMIGGREYARGDRVIARHNDRGLDLDNGTLGTITNIGRNRLLLVTNSGQGDVPVAGEKRVRA